jgi:hypothetical protein
MNYTDSRQSRATQLNVNHDSCHDCMSAVTRALLVVCVVVAKASHYMMS